MNEKKAGLRVSGELKRSVEALVEAVEASLQAQSDEAGEDRHRIRKEMAERVRAVRSHMAHRSAEFLSGARAVGERSNRFVREKPWLSLGAGAAIGLLAGLILRARR